MENHDGGRADWDDIKTFVAAAQAGSFGAAARRLRTSQPTITRRIDDLETRLGVRLFDRGLRGVSLTRAGERIYDRALSMQRASVDIERLALEADRHDAGEVTIAAPEGVGGFLLGDKIAEFMKESPGIRLAMDCGFYRENPVDAHIDLSIQFTDGGGAPDVAATELATLHYALFASQDYIDTYGAPTKLEAAVGHRFIAHSAQVSERGQWHAKTSAFMELAAPALVVNSSTAMLYAIQRGAGIGPIPTAILRMTQDLVMLDIPPLASGTLWLCHHRDAVKSPRVARVAEWLVSIFDARERPWFRKEFIHPSEFESWAWPAASARA
ncbi:LysR family transcriptional regulator [Phenylobacterium sp.]|uniref:LysR family transcriptional regulator n=1 Tax=Phenylobacterium sp. TaxID=1871053 RepID=UPI003BAAAC0F